MDTSEAPDGVELPGRPWLLGGGGTVCVVRVHGQPLVPVFRTAGAAREFLDRLGAGLSAVYPLLPDETEFVQLLAVAMQVGAGGYVLVDAGRWHVVPFARAEATADLARPAVVH